MITVQEQISEARRIATEQGKTEMKRKAIAKLSQWAVSHPSDVVRDDLWDLVEKLRDEL